MLGRDVKRARASCEDVAYRLPEDASSDHGVRHPVPKRKRARKAANVGPALHVGERSRHTGCSNVWEKIALCGQGEEGDLEPLTVKLREKDRPLPLGAAGLQMGADEQKSTLASVAAARLRTGIRSQTSDRFPHRAMTIRSGRIKNMIGAGRLADTDRPPRVHCSPYRAYEKALRLDGSLLAENQFGNTINRPRPRGPSRGAHAGAACLA